MKKLSVFFVISGLMISGFAQVTNCPTSYQQAVNQGWTLAENAQSVIGASYSGTVQVTITPYTVGELPFNAISCLYFGSNNSTTLAMLAGINVIPATTFNWVEKNSYFTCIDTVYNCTFKKQLSQKKQ